MTILKFFRASEGQMHGLTPEQYAKLADLERAEKDARDRAEKDTREMIFGPGNPMQGLPRPGDRQTPWLDRAGAQKQLHALRYRAVEALLEIARLPHLTQKQYAQFRACAAFVALDQHEFAVTPEPEEAEKVCGNVRDMADIWDAWTLVVGEDAKCSLPETIDVDEFSGKAAAALNDAMFDLTYCAQSMREAREEDE